MTGRRAKKPNAFRLLKQRYELLMGAINEGVYDWNVVDDTIYYSDSVKQAVGLPPQLLKTAADWRNRIHPEDLPRYDAAFIGLFKGRTRRLECDYRYRGLDGSWRWARQHGVAVRGANGRVRRVVGATGDITELKDTEQALKQSEERYALATRAATEGIYEWNVESGALFISDRAREVFGLAPGALRNTDWTARIHPDDFAHYRAAIIEHFKGRSPGVECEYRARDAAGSYRWVLDRGQAVRRADGRAIRLIGAETDITQRKQALEQQTATADILKVISSSPADVQPVFEAILTNALRLCEASFAAVFSYDGEFLQNVAHRHASPQFARFLQGMRARPSRETTTRRCALERRTIHTDDLLNDPEFAPPEAQRNEKVRTALSVPMIREGVLAGVITLWRPEVRAFTDKQIALLETFADQAVIAIENVRLFNETREALEQQTATAEILEITARSPSDVQPVFDAIARNAMRLCDGAHCALFRFDGRLQHFAAHCGVDPQTVELLRSRYPRAPDPARVSGQAILGREVIHLADALSDPRFPGSVETLTSAGNRAVLAAPMLKGGEPIGVIFMVRREPRRFSERQVALLKTFADQAVIALESVRLFNETREALEQQKAIAEVLGVVTQLQTEVQPVFEAIGRNAARLCGALFSCVYRFDGELVHLVATHNLPPAAMEVGRSLYPMRPDRSQLSGRAVLTRCVQRLEDAAQDAEYAIHVAIAGGWRRLLAVPMLRDAEPLGVIAVGWRDPGPIPEPLVELLKTFADQAVIAIEKVRLFNETREALEQQKASGEVLKAISSSIADTAPVFDKILESCQRLFAGTIVGLNLAREDGMLHIGAYQGAHREEFERIFPIPLTPESGSGLCMLERRVVHYPDAERGEVPERTRRGCRAIGVKSVIFAPVLWEGRGLGAIFVGRDRTSSFSEKEIALLRTFADQAAIAIENARLIREIQEKSRQLEVASRHKSEFLANMSHELRTPLNAIIGFTRIVMRQSKEALAAKQYENLEKILASGQNLLALINAVLDLSKVEAGRMELHPSAVELAPVLEQCLRTIEPLASVALVKEFDGGLPQMYVDEEKLRQVVMNLLSNAAKFTEHGTIRLHAQAADGSVAITVADTGIGIAADKLGLIFEEFEQADAGSTRVYGGTGLGLTIARRLARLMGGDIGVESSPGTGSRFTLTLPVRYPS